MNPQNSLELLNMDSATRKKLKSDTEVNLTKFANAQIKDIREFLKSAPRHFNNGESYEKVPEVHFLQ